LNNRYTLSKELASKIVSDIRTAAGADANIIGEGGYILASYDPQRVGNFHEGGKRILSGELDEISVTKDVAASMQGMRTGYVGVVKVEGQRVAAIAITGDPETAKPIQKMAEIALREDIRREMEIHREREIVRAMETQIMDIAEQMKVLSLNGSIQAAKIGEGGKAFKIVVAEMRKLAEKINEVINAIHLSTGGRGDGENAAP
jgi:carbohydrate diacid regulator